MGDEFSPIFRLLRRAARHVGEGNKKFTIKSELHLAEALSLVKRGMVTLWADPHLPKQPQFILGKEKKRYVTVRTVKFLL